MTRVTRHQGRVKRARWRGAGRRAIVGIDVGEDCLDLAIIDRRRERIAYRRVALTGIARAPLETLRERIAAAAPELERGALAIVDSPRWPRDRDLKRNRARPARGSRDLDVALRRLVAALVAAAPALGRLSMFPTPPAAYFLRCIADPRCKPHLQSLGRALFAPLMRREQRAAAAAHARMRGGLLFTRFMIAGFAAYRALETAGIEACESFPDLQFRLAAPTIRLLSKRADPQALAMRQRIIARLGRETRVDAGRPATLDFADAAILALGALAASRIGAMIELRSAEEGRFVFGLSHAQRRMVGACLEGGTLDKRAVDELHKDAGWRSPGRSVARAGE